MTPTGQNDSICLVERQPLLPRVHVVSESGAEEVSQAQCTGCLVSAEGADNLKKVVALYILNKTAHVQQQTVGIVNI